MSIIPFDTLEFAAELIDSGIPEKQANAITKAVNKAQQLSISNFGEQIKHDYELDNIATKRDIRELELRIEQVKSDLQRDLKETELRLELKIAENKADLIRWVVAVGLLQVTIITGLIIKLSGNL